MRVISERARRCRGKTVGTTKYKFTTLSGLVMRQEWGARQKGKTGVPFGTPVLV